MNRIRTFLTGSVVLATSALVPTAQAQTQVSASVGAANMYYWRGYDLGNGDPAIWGDINVSRNGFYTGVWASSGDAENGTEYDVYAGYENAIGDLRFDLSVWSYNYPSAEEPLAPGDLLEGIIGLGYGPVALTHFFDLEGNEDYSYTTLGVTVGRFGLTYGRHDGDAEYDGYSHVDLSYAHNENLGFTLGLVTDDVNGLNNDEAKFVVAFTIPIE